MIMTNKEAIELIQGIEEDGRNVTAEHIEALDLAIKALEERPQGEWILRTDTEWHFECNQCKGLSPWKAQFCGVCGADMRGGKYAKLREETAEQSFNNGFA